MHDDPTARAARDHPGPPAFAFRPVPTRLLRAFTDAPADVPKVVSLVAPVGYGKTVLMVQWHARLRESGAHCFWIGLDERHPDIERVLGSLAVGAPGEPGARAGLAPEVALIRGDDPVERRIEALLQAIARFPAPTTFFIDNLNGCPDEALGALLDALVFRTPSSVRFVWSSTVAPAFDAGRAKLEGLLRQVGPAELGLDVAETRELLGAELAPGIDDAGIAAIVRRTEGWPAAVRLAQIVLADAQRPEVALAGFSGSDEDVAALLNRQVLGGFSPALRDFLLAIAPLRTFDAGLCAHATGDAQAQAHLDLLVRRNVFIVPLDRNRRRYRLHGLFREYLLGEACRRLAPGRAREVLRRAAQWCGKALEWHDAIDYALAADDLAHVAGLLERCAAVYAREQVDLARYVAWVERVQGEGVRLGWETQFWHVWALVFQRRCESGLRQHEALARRVREHARDDPPPEGFALRLDHLRLCIDLFTDRLADALEGSRRFLAVLSEPLSYGAGSVGCIQSVCLANEFRFAEARASLRRAESVLQDIGGDNTLAWVTLIDGSLAVYEGDYAHAHRELEAGLARGRARLGDDSMVCDTLAMVAAKCAVEMGLKAEARAHLLASLRTVQRHVMVDTASCGVEAAVKLWNGGADELVSIPQLRAAAHAHSPRLAFMLSCHLVQRLLRLGRLDDAFSEARQAGWRAGTHPSLQGEGAPIPRLRDLAAATQLDLLVALRQFRQADALVAREQEIAQADGRMARLVELALAQMAISTNAGQPARAARALTQAVGWAARRRIIRPFQDHAATIAALVNETRRGAWPFVLAEEQEFFAAICGDLPTGTARQAAWSALHGTGAAVTPTPRETELLALMDMGLSNQEIAQHSELSVTTIKWHQRNLYRKLEVSTRSAAIARARSLGLLAGA